MIGPLARTVLTRADNDNDGLGQAMIDADLLAQTAEIRSLGIWWSAGLTDVVIQEQSPRMAATLDRMVLTLEQLWPAVIQLSNGLIADRSLLSSDFSRALEGYKTTDGAVALTTNVLPFWPLHQTPIFRHPAGQGVHGCEYNKPPNFVRACHASGRT